VNFRHLFDFCQPINQLKKYTPPYGTARGDPILMEGTVYPYISLLRKSAAAINVRRDNKFVRSK
jgi:hypothetical protein